MTPSSAPIGAPGDLSVSFNSEQLIPARPSGRAPATMTVACAAGTLNVVFGFAGNTMSALGNDAGITLQLDLQAARSRTLPANADNTALVINNTRDAAAFLDTLEGATNLTVRVTPVNSRSLSVRFRVDTMADMRRRAAASRPPLVRLPSVAKYKRSAGIIRQPLRQIRHPSPAQTAPWFAHLHGPIGRLPRC